MGTQTCQGKLALWFEKLMAHAKAHYQHGWDAVVECVDRKDFERIVAQEGFATYNEVFDYYQDWVGLHKEAAEDVQAERGFTDEELREDMTRAMWDD